MQKCRHELAKLLCASLVYFVQYVVAHIHNVIVLQVFSSHAGDQLAAEPRGRSPAEDGCGCHLHSGGQGQRRCSLTVH